MIVYSGEIMWLCCDFDGQRLPFEFAPVIVIRLAQLESDLATVSWHGVSRAFSPRFFKCAVAELVDVKTSRSSRVKPHTRFIK